MLKVCLTVDVEPDCPPYLGGWRGVEEGMPPLLSLLEEEGIRGTFFTTGEAARRYPDVLGRVLERGHELGGHGNTHRAFPDLALEEAREEIALSTEALRRIGPVVSFRAPFLRLPHCYIPFLEEHGYLLDSSRARYKPWQIGTPLLTTLLRVPASVTPSALRAPRRLRNAYLAMQRSPVVLFVHPWEFVDLREASIPWHCRFRTGDPALACLGETIGFLRARGASFIRMDALLPERPAARSGEPPAGTRGERAPAPPP